METLGLFSQLYMWILVVLLFIGVGTGILGFVNHITDKLLPANTSRVNKSVIKERAVSGPALVKDSKTQTGISVDNDWLRFSAFSFLGLLIIVTITGLFSINKKPQVDNGHQFHQNASYPGYSGNYGTSSLSNFNNYHPYGNGNMNNNFNSGFPDQFNVMINPYVDQQYPLFYGSYNSFQNSAMIQQSNGSQNGLHNHILQGFQ